MKCPECKEEIKSVRVYSEGYRQGYLEEGKNSIGYYGPLCTESFIAHITEIDCPECGGDITEAVET